MKNYEQHIDIVIEVSKKTIDLSPAWVATEVMVRLGFGPNSPKALSDADVYELAHGQLRQIVRGRLRKHDPIEAANEDDDLFPETLQERYPRVPLENAEPIYALRDHLTNADVNYNVKRMRRVSNALAKHADALEVWHRSRGDVA